MSIPYMSAIIHNLCLEAEGIVSIELRPLPGLPDFPLSEPGAHIDLLLGNGLVRSYSLVNPGEGKRYVVAVLHDARSRGGSRYVHEQLRVGQIIQISAPRNHFCLNEDAPFSVLVAGGIGITPIWAMVQRLAATGKKARLIYCARSRHSAPFLQAIETLAKYTGDEQLEVHLYFDDEQGGPPNLSNLLSDHNADTHFYCCGPIPMLKAFEQACLTLDYPYVHTERFKADEHVMSPTGGYQVELRRTGKVLDIAAGERLVDRLEAEGVAPAMSCREGLCGTCETRVLQGEVDHRDSILTETERQANRSMMVCVSSGRYGMLVLDL